MKRKISYGILIGIISLMIGACGCKMQNSEVQSKAEMDVTLNQRQKDILREQGLSTEYTNLSISQQKAIVSIEKMLCYADKKYRKSFSYAGYVAQNPLETEHMYAFPTEGDKEMECFTITKTEDGYEDNYLNVAANTMFISYVSEGIKDILPGTKMKIFTEITKTTLTEVPTKDTDFSGKIESCLWIFMDGEMMEQQELVFFKEELHEYLAEHELYGMVQLILLHEGEIPYLTKYNYTDYLSDERYIVREIWYVEK